MEDDIQNLDSFNFNNVVSKKSKMPNKIVKVKTTSNKDNMRQRATKRQKKESNQRPKMSTIIEENTESVHEGNVAIMIEKNTENNKIEIAPDNAANAAPLLRRKRKLYSPKDVKNIEEVPLKSQENDDSKDFKEKIEISKRNSTTTSGAEEGTMVLRRDRVLKRVHFIDDNSNITIRQRTKKKLTDIKPANELIDESMKQKNEVLKTSIVVDVPQMVEGEPERVLEKKLRMEPITEKAEKSNKNDLFDKEYYEQVKLANKGDEVYNFSTDSEDFKEKIEISKRNSTTTSGAEEGTMVLRRDRVLKRVHFIDDNSNITIRQRTKKKLADIKPANELIDESMRHKNEVLETSVVVDVPQMVEGEPEVVLEKKLQMEPITEKAEKSNKNDLFDKEYYEQVKLANKGDEVYNFSTDSEDFKEKIEISKRNSTTTSGAEEGTMVLRRDRVLKRVHFIDDNSNITIRQRTKKKLADIKPANELIDESMRHKNEVLETSVVVDVPQMVEGEPEVVLEKKLQMEPITEKAEKSNKNDLFDKEYYEQVKLANRGDEVYNFSTDSEDFKEKIEISKRTEEGTMVLRRDRVLKRVHFIDDNSNITIRQRTKKKLADIKPANELIDESMKQKNEVLETSVVVDVPQMVEGEPEVVLEKKLQMEPITEKAEKSNKNDLFDKEYYEQVKLANKGDEVYNFSTDSEDFKEKIEISKRNSTTTSGAEEGTMVLRRDRVLKRVHFIDDNSNITIRQRTKKKLADIKPANELIDESMRHKNEVLETSVVVDVPQMVEGEPEVVLEKKLQMEPITEKAEKSNKNDLFDKEYYEQVKLANRGDEVYNFSTDSEDFKEKIEISKRTEEGTMVLRRDRVLKRVHFIDDNSNITIRQRTKKKLADIKPANELINESMRQKNEVLETSVVVDVPQMVEGEPELVLEKKLQMEPITEKSNKNQQKGKISEKNKAKAVDLIKAAEKPVVIKNTIDNDRTESPLTDLVVEETLTKNKEDGDLSTNMVDKFKKLCRNPERYINESNTTQNLLSDHERMINSPQTDDLTDEFPLVEISSSSSVRLESKSDVSIATVGITGHGDSGEAPPSPKLIMEPFAHRNLETEYLDTSTKDYFEKLIYDVISNSNVDKLSHTSLSDDENYMKEIGKTISKTRTEVLSNQSSIEKEESVKKVIPKKKMILDLNKNNEQENFAHSSESESVQDKISTSTNIDSRNLKRMMADDIFEPKRKKVLGDFNSGSGITVSSVDDWFKRNEPSSSRAGASINLLKECIQNVIEKLETTLTEINQNTSCNVINLFLKADLKLRDVELECENMYKREASNLFSEMLRTIDEKMIELNKRFMEQHLTFKKSLREEFSALITEDCKKKLIMVQLLKEYIQSIIEHAGNSTE